MFPIKCHGLLWQMPALLRKGIGTVLTEVMRAGRDRGLDLVDTDRLRHRDHPHLARVAPRLASACGDFFEGAMVTLAKSHVTHLVFRNAIAPWRPHVPPDARYEK